VKSRLIASLAIGALVIFGTSGCAMFSTQATTIPYSPADGVNVPNNGPLDVRNVVIIADEEGTDGNLIAAIVNTTDEAQTLSIEYGDGSSQSIRVKPNQVLSLGSDDTKPLLLEDIDTMPGATLPMYFQSGDAEGVSVEVPVLDGSLEYLELLAP
jgi:hypothetical protein